MSTRITAEHRRPRPPRFRHFGIAIPSHCRDLIERGALVAVNASGGKDSQAMTILLSRIVPHEQILIVHAPLGEVEWPGTIEHIERTMPAGVPLIFARTASGKTLLERIEERGRFPDSGRRYCTSDTKRGPIERELRRYLKVHLRFQGRIVSALGLRRDESADRAKRIPWKHSERNSRAKRVWFDWLPIFHLTEELVFHVIRGAGQKPHWVYGYVSRCSCSFCIFSSRSDLRRAAELRPGLYKKYVVRSVLLRQRLRPDRHAPGWCALWLLVLPRRAHPHRPGSGSRRPARRLPPSHRPGVPLARGRTVRRYEAVSGRTLPRPASAPSFGVLKWRGAEHRHEVAVWLAGRFLGWLSSPPRRRCRTACDWRADDRILIALGASHAMVRSEPPRSLEDAERRVTEFALANLTAARDADDAPAETSRRVDKRHSAYYGRL